MCIPQTGAPFFCVRTFLPLTASVMNISCVHALIRNMNKGWKHETLKFLPLTVSVMIISCMHAQIRHVKSFLKLKNMENPFSFTLFAFDVMPQSGALYTMFHCDMVFGLLSSKCHITNHVLSKCTGHHQCEKHLTHTFVHGIWRQLVSKNNQILEYEVTACRTDRHVLVYSFFHVYDIFVSLLCRLRGFSAGNLSKILPTA